MSALVIDASVAVKWLLPEEHTDRAEHILLQGSPLHAPELLALEVRNVLVKRKRRKEISKFEAVRLANAFSCAPIHFHQDAQLLDAAFGVSMDSGISLYDSVYLALATFLEVSLVTADVRMWHTVVRSSRQSRVIWIGDARP